MKPERFRELFEDTLRELQQICGDKNAEYSRSTEDKLANFKRRSARLDLDTLSVLAVDLFKHMDAIESFIIRNRCNSHVALNDPIERRILDSIVYLILLRGLIEDAALKQQQTATALNEYDGIRV